MASKYNPFTDTKRHGGAWIGPSGAEPFYRGQELVDITSHDDYRELRKHVVFQEEGVSPVLPEVLQQPSEDPDAMEEGVTQPLVPSSERKKLNFANSFVERQRVTASDLAKMNKEERQAYLKGLLATKGPPDPTDFLNKVAERAHDLDIIPGKVEIRFDNVKVETQYVHGARIAAPVLHKANENLQENFRKAVKLPETELRTVHLLQGCSGILKPGRLTLMLGPPASGKSTLMKVLSGRLDDKKMQVTFDSLLYNNKLGRAPFNKKDEGEIWLPHCSAFIDEDDDTLLPELTVRETIYYAAEAQGVGPQTGLLQEISRRETDNAIPPLEEVEQWKAIAQDSVGKGVNYAAEGKLALFGLQGVADTVVGSEVLRGVTGADRKLLAIAESVAGPVRVVFIDNAGSGLGSRAEVDYLTRLKRVTTNLPLTIMVSMDQPSAALYHLFDDVMLMSDGHIVFHGPREEAVHFLESRGLSCPPDADPVDFLTQATHPQYQKNWTSGEPVSPAELAEAFKQGRLGEQQGRAMNAEWELPHRSTHGGNRDLQPLKDGPPVSPSVILLTLLKRELAILRRGPNRIASRFFLTFLVACATALTWFQTPARGLEKGYNFAGLLFFSAIRMWLSSYHETSTMIRQLPAFFKHRDAGTFPAWMYPLPYCLAIAAVISLIDSTIWSIIVYFIVQMAGTFGHFLVYWFILWWTDWLGILTFRLCALAGRTIVPTQYITTLVITAVVLLTGYIQHYDKIRGWYIWFFWFNPLSWIWRALMINEFTAGRWAYLYGAPWPKHESPGESPAFTLTTGEANLNFFFVQKDIWWIWVGGWLFVWGFIIIFLGLMMLALTLRKPRPKRPALSDTVESQLDFEDYANIKAAQGKEPATNGDVPTEANHETEKETGGEGSSGDVEMSPMDKSPPEVPAESPDRSPERPPGSTVLPVTSITMTFKDMDFTVPKPNTNPKEGVQSYLFKDVTGVFRPSTICAIMGNLGSGKKMLMDVFAGRAESVPRSMVHGEIHVNGYPYDPLTVRDFTGYVDQMDALTPNSTVFEGVMFSARMRLQKDIPLPIVVEYVDQVIAQCELEEVRNARIGYAKEKGLSIEQRKRLHIATELAANPSLLFLDEPTTRLEARDAAIVMSILRNAANQGRTIVCTLQQPRLEVFLACDDLLLLKPGGRVIYFGAIGDNAQHVTEYFESIPGIANLTPDENPAQWMLEVASLKQEEKLEYGFHEIYQQSQLRRNTLEVVDENHIPQQHLKQLPEAQKGWAINKIPQNMQLLKRNIVEATRDGRYNRVRAAYTFALALIFIVIFWNQGNKRQTPQGIVQIMGMLFAAVTLLGISNAISVMAPTALQRAVFFREHRNRYYSTTAYVLAQFMAEAPWLLAQSLLFVVIFYWPLSFYPDAGKFFWYILFFWLTLSYWTFSGISLTNTLPTLPIAAGALTFLFTMWIITCGYFIPRPQLPGWSVWFYFINPLAWSLYGLMGTQLANIRRAYTFVMDGTVSSVSGFVLDVFGFHYWQACAVTTMVLIAYTFVFLAVSYVGLKVRPLKRLYGH